MSSKLFFAFLFYSLEICYPTGQLLNIIQGPIIGNEAAYKDGSNGKREGGYKSKIIENIVNHFVGSTSFDKPIGIFSDSPPSDSMLKSPQVDFVDGFLVRVPWKELEPAEGSYNWSLFDQPIKAARLHGKKITLAVLSGPTAPGWLYSEGAQSLTFVFQNQYNKLNGDTLTIPIPWDSVYLSEWEKMIRELGARYDTNRTVTLIHITTSGKNGLEMQLPPPGSVQNQPSDYSQWGYQSNPHSREIIQSTEEVMDTFARVFPDKNLDIEVHPTFQTDSSVGDSYVSQQIAQYGHNTIGKRFGLFAAWWSDKNIQAYPNQYNLLKQSASESFATTQMTGSQTATPDRLNLENSINLGIQDNIHYFEVWPQDLLNPDFASYFESIHADSLTGILEQSAPTNPSMFKLFQNYPNPFNPSTVISYRLSAISYVTLRVYNILGKELATLVNREKPAGEYNVIFSADNLPSGIYFYQLKAGNYVSTKKMVLLR